MAKVSLSDSKWSGRKMPKTVLELLNSAGKKKSLQNILSKEGMPTSLVTDSNADFIAQHYSEYTSYVASKGGVIGSLGSVIEALSFIFSQSLAYENVTAFSAKFGCEVSVDGYVSKLFGLGANNDLSVNTANSVTITTDSNRLVLNFAGATSAYSSTKTLSLLNGIIAGTSCRDLGNVNTNSMRGIVLSGSSTTTSNAHTELGHNLPTGNYAKHYVSSALTTIGDNATGDMGYSGLATIAKVGATAKLWKNGAVVATGGTQMAYTLPNTYLFIANGNVANNKLYESWIIFSDSETIAANLSTYLNNS
ncbi:TPA: hypothetical protein SLF30_000444 [Acinetobacter baumannii]|nr:hypothetical protein [Acinetobacter baumannii]